MGIVGNEVDEDSQNSCTVKVHHAMCTQLKMLIVKILRIIPDIEAARPGCSTGIPALVQLQSSVGKAEQLLQNCSESSMFYLAITSDITMSRFERTRRQLVQSLHELQSMVPQNVKLEISQLIDDLRRAVFVLEPSEQEAGKVIRALLQKEEHILASFGNSELHAIQFAASRLHITSQKDILIEKRSIKKMLNQVGDSDRPKREKILKYLDYILRKYDKLVLEWQPQDEPSLIADNFVISGQVVNEESRLTQRTDDAQSDVFHSDTPPKEFKCPLSSRLMSDPVVIASGHTFERVFIEKWFDDGHDTCPTTEMKLNDLSLLPNTSMKNFISKWCKERGIDLYESQSTSQPSGYGFLENSSNSISSCGSLAGLHLQIDFSNVSLGSVDTSFNSDDIQPKTPAKSSLSRENSPLEFRIFSSTSEIETDLLCNICQLPWESQCMAIEDAQDYLGYSTRSRVPLSLQNFVEPVVGFLKAAADRQDTKAQIAGSRLILTGARTSRNAISCMDEAVYALLASFLGTEVTRDVLDIFELAVESGYGAKLAQYNVLTFIIQILETQKKEFHETAFNILHNLSLIDDSCLQKFLPRECIPRLVPFLKESSFSGRCIAILEKLFYSEEARILAVETEGCISSIIELLETGNCEEQEHALSILLSFCTQYVQCCHLAIEKDILPSLFGIAVNGNDKGKVIASELLRQLDFSHEGEQEACSYSDGDDNDDVRAIPSSEDNKKVCSKGNGFLRKLATKLKKR